MTEQDRPEEPTDHPDDPAATVASPLASDHSEADEEAPPTPGSWSDRDDGDRDDRDRELARKEAVRRVIASEPARAARRRREPDPDPAEERPRGRWRTRLLVLALLGLVGAVGWGLGARNHERFWLVCFPDRIEPQRGTRWPWGREAMEGEAFAGIKVPPDADCAERELPSGEALRATWCDLLLTRIEAELAQPAPKLDEIGAKASQAQLLVRGRPERRARLMRLAADLSYLRGQRGVEQAGVALKAAIGAFREAKVRGSGLGHDSDVWVPHLERVLRDLAAPRPGEPGAPASQPRSAPAPAPPDGTTAPPPGGVLL